jgi:hypothetical protein
MKVTRIWVDYFKDSDNVNKSRFGITVQGKTFLQNLEITKSDFDDLCSTIAQENGIGKGEKNQANEYLLRITYEVL